MLSVTRVAGVLLLAGCAVLLGSGAVWGFNDARDGRDRDKDKQTAGKAAAPQTPSGAQVQPDAGRGRGPGPGDVRAWWKDRDMAKEVGLSSIQIAKIDALYEQRKKQIKPKVDEYNKLRDELGRMVEGRTAKPEEIENQAKKMMFPRYDIDVSRTKMLYEMSLVLSADQNTRFLAMFDRMDKERRAAMEKLEQERDKGRRGGGNHQRQ